MNPRKVIAQAARTRRRGRKNKMKRENLKFVGWGLIGEPNDMLVNGPAGDSLDVTGYMECDYWGPDWLGPDPAGIVPVYETKAGDQFPAEATQYPHLA